MIWYVAFHPKKKQHWWARRFGHVSLAGYENNTWFYLDLNRTNVMVQTYYAQADVRDFITYLLDETTLIKYGKVKTPGQFFLRPMSCVSFVKHALGMRSRALLPDGLFRHLRLTHDVENVEDEVTETPKASKTGSSNCGTTAGGPESQG